MLMILPSVVTHGQTWLIMVMVWDCGNQGKPKSLNNLYCTRSESCFVIGVEIDGNGDASAVSSDQQVDMADYSSGKGQWKVGQAQISKNLSCTLGESCFVSGVEIDAIDDDTAITVNPCLVMCDYSSSIGLWKVGQVQISSNLACTLSESCFVNGVEIDEQNQKLDMKDTFLEGNL